MYKLNKVSGFVALPIIIGSAVLAVGILGGLAYEYKDKLISGIDKNNLLASTIDLIQNAELNRIKFSAIGQDIRLSDITFKLTSGGSNLQNQSVALYDFNNNQVGQIYFTAGNLVATSSLIGFVIPTDSIDGTVVLKVKGTIVSGSSVKIDYVSSKGVGQFSGNTIWDSSFGATAVTFNTLTELNRITFLANGQSVGLTDVALKLESGNPSNLQNQSVQLYANNMPVGQIFFTAGNLVATSSLSNFLIPTGDASITLIIKGITNSPLVNIKYAGSKAVGYSSGVTIWDSSSGATAVTFNTPLTTCASFTYSDWSVCSSNSQQARTVISSSPSGCTGGSPVTTQSCNYVAPISACTSFAYSDWGTCESINNHQFRNITSSSPSGCTGGNPITSQSCNYVAPVLACTSFTYSDWSVCQSNNTQYRSVTTSSPFGCTGGSSVTTQSCSYSVAQPTTQTQQTQTVQPVTQAAQQPTIQTSITSAPASQSTNLDIQSLIAKLMEQIRSIQQQLATQQGSQPTTSSVAPSTSASSQTVSTETISAGEDTAPVEDNQTELFSYTWNKDLYYGLTNDKDVEALQNALVMEGCYTGPVTGNFYRLTRAGVICFQKKHNFTNIPGTGYIGSYTRKVLNELYSK